MRIRTPKIDVTASCRGIKIPENSYGTLVTSKDSSVSTNKIYQLFLRYGEERGSLCFPFRASPPSRSLHPLPDVLDSASTLSSSSSSSCSGINQDKCLGNIVVQRLAGTGNGSLWSDTYFVRLGEFFSPVLALITVFDIRRGGGPLLRGPTTKFLSRARSRRAP